MATRSRTACGATLWDPQEHEIRLHSQPDPGDVFPFASFWYLQLSPEIMIGVGRQLESVASDAAAMRRLAALASEVAFALERRAAAQAGDAAGDGPGGGAPAWCGRCRRATGPVPCPRCGGEACAVCGRCPPCDGPVRETTEETDG